jgi:SAM-dependent methyltransferase
MTDHSKAAKYYQYRNAYLPVFFEGCAQTLDLDGSQRLLDVACGTGVVARGFSPYVDSIIAFDESKDMVQIAADDSSDYPNIQILHSTFDDLDLSGEFDLVTFGRSIHWMDRATTLSTLGRLLKPGGHIIVCGSGFSKKNVGWTRAYFDIWPRWWRGKKAGSFDGQDIFRKSAFAATHYITSEVVRKLSVEDLINISLSYSGLTESVEAARDDFRHDLEVALRPFLRNGTIEAHAVTWGRIFKSKQS